MRKMALEDLNSKFYHEINYIHIILYDILISLKYIILCVKYVCKIQDSSGLKSNIVYSNSRI